MRNHIIAVIMIVFGLQAILFSRWYGRRTEQFGERWFGFKNSLRTHQFGYIAGGLVFVIAGVLELLGVLKFRPWE